MEQIFGKGVSKGVAAGPISFYRRPSGEILRRSVTDTAAELVRFHDACETAKEQLGVLHDKALTEAGEDAAMLFEAHQMMLDDLDFVESIEGLIENDRLNAEAAVSDTGAQFAEMFAAMDDSYMQARAADIRDISTRVIGILTGEGESGIVSDVPCIVEADDLAPSETVQLDKSLILGFITAGGSANSHTAILARTMGIPAIIGAGDALQTEMEGKYAIVDGQTGEMVIEPDDAERERLLKKQAKEKALKELLDQLKGKPNVTKDGRNVMVYCNIGSPADIDAVLQNDGGGIGLFRSEFLYLQGSDYPTEDEQFEAYKTVAERMGGKRVIIRTLDIGADKQADYFHLDKEENPAMGLRAIRICLTRPEVFRTQLRALYRASAYGKIAIMFPMITSVWEVQEIKRICRNIRAELAEEGVPMADKVELHWISGRVEIRAAETISVSENFAGDNAQRLRWRLDGDTLIVQPCASGAQELPEKTLTVTLPQTVLLKVDTVSADCALTGVQTAQLDVDSVSGALRGDAAVTEMLSVDTVSGGASLDLTAAPKKELVFDEAPGTVKLSSTSGSFALGLPAGAAYQLDWSTVSGDCDASGYQAPEGRGAKKIKLTADTVSGGLTIYTK